MQDILNTQKVTLSSWFRRGVSITDGLRNQQYKQRIEPEFTVTSLIISQISYKLNYFPVTTRHCRPAATGSLSC